MRDDSPTKYPNTLRDTTADDPREARRTNAGGTDGGDRGQGPAFTLDDDERYATAWTIFEGLVIASGRVPSRHTAESQMTSILEAIEGAEEAIEDDAEARRG